MLTSSLVPQKQGIINSHPIHVMLIVIVLFNSSSMDLPNNKKCAIIYAINVQIYLRQEDKEQENHNFCSPEQVLSLLRFVRQADFARLATHPFAYSKTTLS